MSGYGGVKRVRLIVSNLHWTIGKKELINYFKQFGGVRDAAVMYGLKTGISRSYGFVTLYDELAVKQILEKTNGHCIDGHYATVDIAVEQQQHGRGGTGDIAM